MDYLHIISTEDFPFNLGIRADALAMHGARWSAAMIFILYDRMILAFTCCELQYPWKINVAESS